MRKTKFLFLKTAAAVALGLAGGAGELFAQDKAQNDAAQKEIMDLYAKAVPAKKGLDEAWVRSLAQRGGALDAAVKVENDRKALANIGMTIGGGCSGTVYLSGDGRLFVWDIFNKHHEGVVPRRVQSPENMPGKLMVRERDGANYISAPTADEFPGPFQQEFSISVGGKSLKMNAADWKNVSFDGKWPLGTVTYSDPAQPVQVELKAWAPFIPLNTADSLLPVTVMEYTVKNTSGTAQEVSVKGAIENPILIESRKNADVDLNAKPVAGELNGVQFSAQAQKAGAATRADIPFADFEQTDWKGWKTEGTAFGAAPISLAEVPPHQGDIGQVGDRAVNSHASAPGSGIEEKDAAVGSVTSSDFSIERKFLKCLIGGGNRPEVGLEVLVNGKVVGSVSGKGGNKMTPATVNLSQYEGQKAQVRIFDRASSGGWANVGVDQIVFSDSGLRTNVPVEKLPDFGTFVLGTIGNSKITKTSNLYQVSKALKIEPGKEATASFVLSWHFPNLYVLPGLKENRRHFYSVRYKDAEAVASYVAKNFERLKTDTLAWVSTYSDASVPQWVLDRSALTTNTLNTANCFMIEDPKASELGRFWAWEGIGACAGTCAHVWHYAQGVARLFPEIERNLREITDYGYSLNPDGSVNFRAESGGIALDAQTGVILRTYREHTNSKDSEFLKRVWPNAKKAMEWLIAFDKVDKRGGLDGLLDGRQHNTLDADWYGKVHCLCSMYLASLRAAEEMANEVGDVEFAKTCHGIFEMGSKNIAKLFNGEFYIQDEDPAHAGAIGVGTGCYIDQVIGQWWANNVNLGLIYDKANIHSALNSLWKYNFVPEIGHFRESFTAGRFYALPGEKGLVMCTWPKGGLRPDFKKHWQFGYFNECMTGFEWQAAAHMIQEGAPISDADLANAGEIIENDKDPRALTLRGLAVSRAIHDRYAPQLRNPYNEIECSDHYGRAAASYSVFLASCGFSYHGPKGQLGFAPKLNPQNFKAPFTAAEAWGTFEQKQNGEKWQARVVVNYGSLKINELQLPWLKKNVSAILKSIDGSETKVDAKVSEGKLSLNTTIQKGQSLIINEA